ncbi:hypothetical protein NFX46_18260 [Streptomyces phaeoluteigriseus]|uniref:Uncharacterized protein n=1 Tax=Streptomyces phaeoluteigriseus TaxID=114686 RepID=A0ABY4Z9B7_9ACTN|nr:hypothetical protein [Streptomyces phaeoluteigriseus]USQ85546.1 hypothetical protein NFX46_18260 [Streptomyces phaeoluteigriseus]
MGLGDAGRRHASSEAFVLDRRVPADAEPRADLDAQAAGAEHATADSVRAALNRVGVRRLTLARADGGGPYSYGRTVRGAVGTGGRNRAAAAVRTPTDGPPDDGESNGIGGRVRRPDAGSDPDAHPACGAPSLGPAPAARDDTGTGTAAEALDSRTVSLRNDSPARAGDAGTDARRLQAGNNHLVHVRDGSGRR